MTLNVENMTVGARQTAALGFCQTADPWGDFNAQPSVVFMENGPKNEKKRKIEQQLCGQVGGRMSEVRTDRLVANQITQLTSGCS